jgi:hypothetical protein
MEYISLLLDYLDILGNEEQINFHLEMMDEVGLLSLDYM